MIEGALFAGLAVVMALIGFYLPLIGIFTTLAWPVLIVIIALRQGMRTATLTVVVTGMLLSMFLGPLQGIIMSGVQGIIGLAIGYAMIHKMGPVKTVLLSSVAQWIGTGIEFVVSLWFLQLNILTDAAEQMQLAAQRTLDYMQPLVEKYPALEPSLVMTKQMASPEMLKLSLAIAPASLAVGGVALAMLNYWFCKKFLPRFGYPVADFPEFSSWRLPWYWLLVFIVAQIMSVITAVDSVPFFGRTIEFVAIPGRELIGRIGTNLALPASVAVAIQGYSLAFFYLKRWTNKGLASMILFFSLGSGLGNIVLMFGLMDFVFDYRKWVTAAKSGT
jgi:uncharacterized protein YybS (DUF2232 family)